MGYLRGTKGSSTVIVNTKRPKTVKEELRSLKRHVALNKNAPHYFNLRSTLNSSGATSWTRQDISITDAFTSSTTYHDNISGDEYRNNTLQTKVDIGQDVAKCRMIIYVPKNPGIVFTPALSNDGFITQPDPNSFWVLKDVYINHNTDVFTTATTYWCNLRGLKTIFNTDANNIEKGNVRFMFLYLNTSTASGQPTIFVSNQLSVTDK